ncbi:coiled-coil domain-containing protein 113 isoform X2 [Nilaparvata lugens]|uniref:coiled-coil domain-containing protein 113 isoform X2 n=1 Tax=Nilaparvata lugens TaxID=108931 RepID=UPI00193D97B8|nr:coiled-coil domain-containing protein 113 isoform X2 [Nilaparvata lugens]
MLLSSTQSPMDSSMGLDRSSLKEEFYPRYSEISNDDLKHLIKNALDAVFFLSIENNILEKYLGRVQPSSLTGMPQSIDTSNSIAQRIQLMMSYSGQKTRPTGSKSRGSVSIRSVPDTISDSGSPSLAPSRQALLSTTHRLSVSFFTELITRELEELKTALETLSKEGQATMFNLNAQIAEKRLALEAVKSLCAAFEQNVLIDGLDPLNGRLSSQKYLRFVNDTTLKDLELKYGKMRLRCSSVRSQLVRVRAQYEQRVELGDTIHAVDFDELTIHNKAHSKVIDDKNNQILKLKKVTAICGQNLITNYRNFERILEDHKNSVVKIKERENTLEKIISEAKEAGDGIELAQRQNTQIEELITNYTAPAVMDYIKLKAELLELKRNMNIWTRKVDLQQNTISLLTHKLKSKSGLEQKSHWLRRQDHKSANSSESTEDTSTKVQASTTKSVTRKNSRINV